ncbi:MAG: 50S ribosomal protein L7ae [Candidatus Aenigmarchaeota archaeon ex4484_52]|nr:MAG: 50S ribosomal protein L7ae [Candidatus Aenigmarchaeota archaeon ex4484_52]
MNEQIEQIIGFKTPNELVEQIYSLIDSAKSITNIKTGVNEVTKSIEKEKAKLIIIAEDINPIELIMHLPGLCREKKISFASVPSKQELGVSAGLKVSASCIAIEDENIIKENKKLISDIDKLWQ